MCRSDRDLRSGFPLASQADSPQSRPSPEGRLFCNSPGGFHGWLRGPLRPRLIGRPSEVRPSTAAPMGVPLFPRLSITAPSLAAKNNRSSSGRTCWPDSSCRDRSNLNVQPRSRDPRTDWLSLNGKKALAKSGPWSAVSATLWPETAWHSRCPYLPSTQTSKYGPRFLSSDFRTPPYKSSGDGGRSSGLDSWQLQV